MTREKKNNETNPTDDLDLISSFPFKSKKITMIVQKKINSQRDTIFKDELDKRLPSGGELKAQIIQETIDCNNRSNSEYYAEDYCEGFVEGIKWLIQYIKKDHD